MATAKRGSNIKPIDPEQAQDIVLTEDDLAQVAGGVVNMDLVESFGKPTDSADKPN